MTFISFFNHSADTVHICSLAYETRLVRYDRPGIGNGLSSRVRFRPVALAIRGLVT